MSLILVTGASGGIGQAMAQIFAKAREDLILVARRKNKLEEFAEELMSDYGIQVDTISMDLSAQDAASTLYEKVQASGREVDILVNNAAAIETGDFADMQPERLEQLITLNISTLTLLTRLFLSDMLARNKGRILNVSSMGAFGPIPGMACYAASKAFVLSFTESLVEELVGTDVTATVLCPGFTKTEMAMDGLKNLSFELGNLPHLFMAEPDKVAQAGVDACLKGVAVEVPGVANKMAFLWNQTQPRWLRRKVAGSASRWLSRMSQ